MEENEFLFVDFRNIKEVDFYLVASKGKYNSFVKRVFPSLQHEIKYEYKDIEQYFIVNKIPLDFRKMIVVLRGLFTSNIEAEELFTGMPFNVSGCTRKFDFRKKKIICGITSSNDANFHYHKIVFDTKANFFSLDDVRKFYLSLLENNIFEKYIFSLNCLIGYDYTIDSGKAKAKIRKLEL